MSGSQDSFSDAFAFDLDGTLIDCAPRQVRLAEALLAEHGADPIDPERFWACKRAGASTRDALERLGVEPGMAATVHRAWVERVEQPRWLAHDRLLPGAREVLERVREAGLIPMILTARRDGESVAGQVRDLGLSALVAEVAVVDPARVATEKAAWLRSRRPAAYVGDSESDAEAARVAGVPFGAVACGQRDAAYLRARGAEPVAEDTAAAVEHLLARIAARRGATT